ncbi:MAG: hypothetical protein IPP15_00010 [Saprospiraceae bacterium]|uniref:DUF5675 domain-containing protein n=1 Tax=Candidatus Opimibacter skivensis TaxID=2982028 RepID=A0A9D7SPF3_9BACT|nr:hypothetical protein [Candidatus Opimibacter skivensis]
MATLLLIRESVNTHNTKGKLELFNNNGNKIYECLTLELPFKDNQRYISSIPAKEYEVEKHESEKLGPVLHILDVENRSQIYFHIGNHVDGEGGKNQVEGCILVGDRYIDIYPYDGIEDIVNSGETMKKILNLLDDSVHNLIITEDYQL